MKELKSTEHNHQKMVGIHHGSPCLLTGDHNHGSGNDIGKKSYSIFFSWHSLPPKAKSIYNKIKEANLEHHEVLIKHLKPTFHIVVVVDLLKMGFD